MDLLTNSPPRLGAEGRAAMTSSGFPSALAGSSTTQPPVVAHFTNTPVAKETKEDCVVTGSTNTFVAPVRHNHCPQGFFWGRKGVENLMTFRASARGTPAVTPKCPGCRATLRGRPPSPDAGRRSGGGSSGGRTLLLLPPSLQTAKSPRWGAHPVPALIKFHTQTAASSSPPVYPLHTLTNWEGWPFSFSCLE